MHNLKSKEDMSIQELFEIYWKMTQSIENKDTCIKTRDYLENKIKEIAN